MLNIGDAVALVATPVARGLGMDCIDPTTQQLRPDSNCAKRKAALNQLGERIHEFFVLPEQRKKGETMKFRCQLIVIVDADRAEDVISKVKPANGELYTYSVSPITQTPQTTAARVAALQGAIPQNK